MAAPVYFRLCESPGDGTIKSEWYVLDYEKEEIRRADVLMKSWPPSCRVGSEVLAVGSEIYFLSSSSQKGFTCDRFSYIDTRQPQPEWTTPSELPYPCHDPVCATLDGIFYVFNLRVCRNALDIWADVLDSKTKKWSYAKVPQPLPFELTEEGEEEGFHQWPPIVADPANNQLLLCYRSTEYLLFAYRPTANQVERISNEDMLGWNEKHAVVDGVLYSSSREVHSLSDSLFAYDLANGVRPLNIDWSYSANCIRSHRFEFPPESSWEAVIDLGNGKLLLAMNLRRLRAAWDVMCYIGGLTVEVGKSKDSSSSSSENSIVICVLSAFLIPIPDETPLYRARDFLSVATPSPPPAI